MLKIDLLHGRDAWAAAARDCPTIDAPLRSRVVNGSFVANRYRIQRLLGRGGMGAVYEALDTKSSTLVALKVISEELAQNAALRSRFEQEQRAAAAIASPHLVRILDAGDDAGRLYMVMEYLRGEDLGQLLERVGPLSEQLALRIVGQASAGIGRAHDAGVVHRDLKPANIFLARGEGGAITVKVLDFGVAKLAPAEGTVAEQGSLTRTGTVLGSPLYMSPEQARGGRTIGPRADIWSLGVVLYRTLAGREPHDTVSGLGDLIIAICTRPSPPVQLNAPWISREAVALVHRALAIDPDARFGDAQELGEAIRKIAGELALREDELVGVPELERLRRPAGNDDATLCMPAHGTRRASAVSAAMNAGAAAGKRILLVEDNELNMDMLARRLEKKGYEIVRATDGESGVSLGQSAHPHLVIMDIGLPGIDGWEASRRLRASGESQAVPILALTAHAMGGEREKAIAAGCDDFESKPIEFPRLLAKIEALLGRR
jgi:serine/threonine-protein kinase